MHWANGGETTLDNLTLLCRKHHRFLHEYGFQLERMGRELRFLKPDGTYVPDVPHPQECENDALRDAHARERVAINPATAVCHWNGASPRYDWIVGLLQERSPLRAQPALHVKCGVLDPIDIDSDIDDAETQQMLREQQQTTERLRVVCS